MARVGVPVVENSPTASSSIFVPSFSSLAYDWGSGVGEMSWIAVNVVFAVPRATGCGSSRFFHVLFPITAYLSGCDRRDGDGQRSQRERVGVHPRLRGGKRGRAVER